jgi:tetratricopeptide (TPR) repeat protein
VLPLIGHSLGAPLGEPVAEDFDFLHRALLGGNHSLLDGGGSMSFWRPVSHQLYYLALGPLMLGHPRAVAALHALLMALAALLVYFALRRSWSGPAAAVAASFPLFAESTRTLLAWPSHFVDLGLWLFTALAMFSASRGRLWLALAALIAALGCKELAVVAVLLLPWMPGVASGPGRRRWVLATGLLAVAWAGAYLAVRRHAHLELPHGLEHNPQVLATPLATRFAWAAWSSLRAIFSLPIVPSPHGAMLGMALLALGLAVVLSLIARRAAAARRLGWMAWGLTWFALASATLVAIFPIWQPNRSAFGSLGLGITLAALAEAAHPLLLAALFVLRLALFALSPGPPATVSAKAPETGAFMDFDHLVRLQRLMHGIRERLGEEYPRLPAGAQVCQTNMPRMAEYAFGKSYALQAWYRDTTIRWMRYDDFKHDTSARPITIVQYEPDRPPMIALVDPRAMRLIEQSADPVRRQDWGRALAMLREADTLQRDRGAAVFFAILGTQEAGAYSGLGRYHEEEAAARMALAQWPGSPHARYWIAFALAEQKRYLEAEAVLDTALAIAPGDSLLLELQTAVREELARALR